MPGEYVPGEDGVVEGGADGDEGDGVTEEGDWVPAGAPVPDEVAEVPAGISVSSILSVGLMSICCALSQALWAASLSCAWAAANGVASKAANNKVLFNVFMSQLLGKIAEHSS